MPPCAGFHRDLPAGYWNREAGSICVAQRPTTTHEATEGTACWNFFVLEHIIGFTAYIAYCEFGTIVEILHEVFRQTATYVPPKPYRYAEVSHEHVRAVYSLVWINSKWNTRILRRIGRPHVLSVVPYGLKLTTVTVWEHCKWARHGLENKMN